MRKKLVLLSFFLSLFILTSSVKSLEVTATSGSASDIQAAINQVNAAGGGTVYIPAGDFLFNPTEDGAVKILGGVNLVGAGKDKTILRNIEPVPYEDWGWGSFFSVDGSEQYGKSVHLSGFTIIGFRELYPNHDARTQGISIVQVKDFIVSDVKIKDTGGSGISVIGWRNYGPFVTQGVITHCDFINTNGLPMGPGGIAYGPNVLGYGVQVDGFGIPEAWIDNISQVLGKYDYGQPVVYIEDCYFSRWRHCIVSNQVGHYVARYNTFDEYTQGFGDVDAHGAGFGNYGTGSRAIEVYNNTFMTPTPADSWTMATAFHRGGGGVYFNNIIKSGRGSIVYLSNDGTDWNPRSDVEKYFTNDVWIWNNNISSGVTNITKYDPEGLIIEGVNYHFNAPTFNYTAYTYPHPLTLQPSSQIPKYRVYGKITNNNNLPLRASITAYQRNASNIIELSQTDSEGNYEFSLQPTLYDIKYSLLDNEFFIKLISLNISSDTNNLIKSITSYSDKTLITANFRGNQTFQIYSSSRPSQIIVNGSDLAEVYSLKDLQINNWFYDSLEQKLYFHINPLLIPFCGNGICDRDEDNSNCPVDCPLRCSDGTIYSQCSSTKPFYCYNGNLIEKCSQCDCLEEQNCNSTTEKCFTPSGIIFEDGFETGDISKWSGIQSYGAGATISVTTQSHSGSYSLNSSDTYMGSAWWQNNIYKSFQNSKEIYAKLYFNAKYLPSNGKRLHLMSFYGNGTSDYGDLQFLSITNSSGTYQLSLLYRRPGSLYDATYNISSLSTNTWYSVEMRRKATNSGLVSAWWNGILVINRTDNLFDAYNGWINTTKISMDSSRNDGTNWIQETLFDDIKVSFSYIE